MPHVIGIDPGQRGAIAVIEDGELIAMYSMPLHPCKHTKDGGVGPCRSCRKSINESLLLDLLLVHSIKTPPLAVIVERQMSRSGQKGQFAIVDHHGWLRGVVVGMGWTLDNPRPAAWQKGAWEYISEEDRNHATLGAKKKSIKAAQVLFPTHDFIPEGCRVPHDGRTDAACIARYGWLKYGR